MIVSNIRDNVIPTVYYFVILTGNVKEYKMNYYKPIRMTFNIFMTLPPFIIGTFATLIVRLMA